MAVVAQRLTFHNFAVHFSALKRDSVGANTIKEKPGGKNNNISSLQNPGNDPLRKITPDMELNSVFLSLYRHGNKRF